MSKMHRFIAMAIVTILMLGSISAIAGCQKAGSMAVPFTTETDRYYTWPGYTLDEAVSKADHIVYGRVVDKKGPIVHKGPKTGMEELFTDTTIQVIRVLKASDTVSADTNSILYLEMPAASDGERYDIPTILNDGKEVILFLSKYSTSLGPDFVIPIENGNAQITPYLKSSDFKDITGSLSVEAFCARILKN